MPAALSSLWKEGCSRTESPWPGPGEGSEPAPLGEQQDTLLRKRETPRKAPREAHVGANRPGSPGEEGVRARAVLSPPRLSWMHPWDKTSSPGALRVKTGPTHRKGEQRMSLLREWSSPTGEKSGEEEGAVLQEKQVTPGQSMGTS